MTREHDKRGYLNHRNRIESIELQYLTKDRIKESIPGYMVRKVAQLYPKNKFGPESHDRLRYGSEKVVVKVTSKDGMSYAGFINLEILDLKTFLIAAENIENKEYKNIAKLTADNIEEIVVLATK